MLLCGFESHFGLESLSFIVWHFVVCVISTDVFARDLHMIAPGPLEFTCCRRFVAK